MTSHIGTVVDISAFKCDPAQIRDMWIINRINSALSDKARMQGSKINGPNVSSVSDKWRPVSYIKSFVC